MKQNQPNNMIEVLLQIACEGTWHPTQHQANAWVNTALELTQPALVSTQNQLAIRVVDLSESQHLNETYRHKMGPTNVLSFPPQIIPGFDPDTLGDLAICAPVVKLEAQAQKKTLEAHWAHMVVHGVLHLCGYDHEEEKDANIMEPLETKILAALGYENPYLPE